MNRLGLGLNRLRVMGILAWAESVLRLVGVHGYFGASGMGEATPIIAIVITIVIADRHVAPISLISLSLFWWLFVLIFGVGVDIGCSVCLSFFFFFW